MDDFRQILHPPDRHRKAYLPFLAEWGIDDIEQAEVITEHFEIVHKAKNPHPRGN